MTKKQKKYRKVCSTIKDIIQKAKELEKVHESMLEQVHPVFQKSAANLVHYLAFRSFHIDKLQSELENLGLPFLSTIESHVMRSLYNLQNILHHLLGLEDVANPKGYISVKKSRRIMRKNNKLLFGYKSKQRRTRIMVTLPSSAADDKVFVRRLISLGMNCARINCAHDNPEKWARMIENIKWANTKLNKKCKIAMDLAGPKLRTGRMVPGPKVININPQGYDLGKVVQPANIWIAPPDVPPPSNSEVDYVLPVVYSLYKKIKRGNTLHFMDSRGKKGKILIDRKEGKGKWGLCSDSVYLETGTELILQKFKQSGRKVKRLGEVVPKEQFITLFSEDKLILHKDPRPGETSSYNEEGNLISPAHISCTLPQVFDDVRPGEPIFFNDGKIEGEIKNVSTEEIEINILHAKEGGSKLKADKGINLPKSHLSVSGLTEKDKVDIDFVAKHADAVNLSFVNNLDDVLELQSMLSERGSTAGIILKIETQKGFANLPSILLTAMRCYPVGVMIARGDLAIETGWKNFATIQQEIIRICGAAHVPEVWATQVLENLAKKGTPSRSEITDASMAQQAACVMLNKGAYIHRAVKMLDKILRRMQRFQNKTAVVLPKLSQADQLILSHKSFDV